MSAPGRRRFAVLHHPKIPHSLDLSEQVCEYLTKRGQETWSCSSWDVDAIRNQLDSLDMLITLGGDGTILRTARVSAPAGKPIIGINLGRVGFLAEMEPNSWREGLDKVLAGAYSLEERMMLHSEVVRNGQPVESCISLNEVVAGRGRLARVVRIRASVDGAELAEYVADGLIAATPTGSTAYSFAAGGPIMPPTLRNILLVPIAPMFGFFRPVVLSEGALVRLAVHTDHEAILTVDGQFEVELASGDEIHIRASDYVTRFARFRAHRYFYDSLATRLQCR